MTGLTLSLLLLLSGPLLLRAARRQRSLLAALDGFTLFGVGGLVCLDIIPHAIEQGGWLAIPLSLAGLFVPTAFERLKSRGAARAHALALFLGMLGVVVHALTDGIALASGGGESALARAVIIHQLPVGIATWWLLRPAYGRTVAAAVLLGTCATTAIGYGAGDAWRAGASSEALGLLTALVAGSLLHVLIHVHGPVRDLYDRPGRFAGSLGALAGLVFVGFSVGHMHPGPHSGHAGHAHTGGESGFFDLFLGLSLESAVPLLIAYLAAGLVFAYLPAATVAWLGRGGSFGSSVRGLVFALPIPICSCGVVPVYKGLVERGAPLGAAMTMLIAGPELGIDAVVLSFTLLDGNFAIARIIAAGLLALAVGWGVGSYAARRSGAVKGRAPPRIDGTARERLVKGLRAGFVELVDDTAPWLVLGIAIAAVAWPLLDGEWLAAIPPWLQVPAFALLGLPVYVCASGATPIAAVLVAQGVSPGAAIAFLLTGPATNVTTFGVLSQLHGRRTALLFATAMAAGAVLLGLGVDRGLGPVETIFARDAAEAEHADHANHAEHAEHAPGADESPDHADGPSLEGALAHDHGPVATAALAAIAALFLASLFRRGPRGFIGQVLAPPEVAPDEHGDPRGHSHGHDHGHSHDHSHDRPSSPGSGPGCCADPPR